MPCENCGLNLHTQVGIFSNGGLPRRSYYISRLHVNSPSKKALAQDMKPSQTW